MAWAIAAPSRIWFRLLLVNVLVAVVPVAGIAFARLHERQLLAALEADMIHQAELVRGMVPVSDAQLIAAARETRTRIRVLDRTGALLADSRNGPVEDVAARREVVAALHGHYAAATRNLDDRIYLCAALPIRDGVVYVTHSTHDVKHQLYVLRTWLVRVLLASLVATILVSLILATTIARPLAKLTRRAERIAARQPVEPDDLAARRDEIGQLARAVATMTDELERRTRDARTLAADISHEFKTPLTGIRGAAELLREGAADDPEARDRFLAMIVDDAARLDRLVSRLLELARVEDDRGSAAPIDLGELARACAARPWPVPVVVTGDATLMARAGSRRVMIGRGPLVAAAIENLVANAVDFADAGPVEIAITGARVAVANRGPALSAHARAHVWDRFYSTRQSSGLGLAIVRSVALAHGGRVGVDCDGGVTTFWFELA